MLKKVINLGIKQSNLFIEIINSIFQREKLKHQKK
jgi:hypothetical protein